MKQHIFSGLFVVTLLIALWVIFIRGEDDDMASINLTDDIDDVTVSESGGNVVVDEVILSESGGNTTVWTALTIHDLLAGSSGGGSGSFIGYKSGHTNTTESGANNPTTADTSTLTPDIGPPLTRTGAVMTKITIAGNWTASPGGTIRGIVEIHGPAGISPMSSILTTFTLNGKVYTPGSNLSALGEGPAGVYTWRTSPPGATEAFPISAGNNYDLTFTR